MWTVTAKRQHLAAKGFTTLVDLIEDSTCGSQKHNGRAYLQTLPNTLTTGVHINPITQHNSTLPHAFPAAVSEHSNKADEISSSHYPHRVTDPLLRPT